MRWITRERPKIDRVACPWLIARFVDRDAEFLFAKASEVLTEAPRLGAIPFDVDGAVLSHRDDRCSFDAIIEDYQVQDESLSDLATIVRGADTDRLDLAPQCAGLLSVSLGLSRLCMDDDHRMLSHGFVVYDALYEWLRYGREEVHGWNPGAGGRNRGAGVGPVARWDSRDLGIRAACDRTGACAGLATKRVQLAGDPGCARRKGAEPRISPATRLVV